jgi:hypothetical protein
MYYIDFLESMLVGLEFDQLINYILDILENRHILRYSACFIM